MSHSPPDQSIRYSTLLGVGIFLLLLSAIVFIDSGRLPSNQSVGVGPAVGMHLVALILFLLALAHIISAWRIYSTDPKKTTNKTSFSNAKKGGIYWLLAGLVGLIVFIELKFGFILGATLLFVCTARAFGQSVGIKPLTFGLLITTLVFLFFTRALSLSLPSGPLEQFLLR